MFDPEAPTNVRTTVTLEASGDVSDYTPQVIFPIGAKFAAQAGVRPEQVEVVVSAGSVLITVTVVSSAEAAELVRGRVASVMSSATMASAFLSDVPGITISVLAISELTSEPLLLTQSVVASSSSKAGVVAGAVLGALAALAGLAALGLYLRKTRGKLGSITILPTTHMPSAQHLPSAISSGVDRLKGHMHMHMLHPWRPKGGDEEAAVRAGGKHQRTVAPEAPPPDLVAVLGQSTEALLQKTFYAKDDPEAKDPPPSSLSEGLSGKELPTPTPTPLTASPSSTTTASPRASRPPQPAPSSAPSSAPSPSSAAPPAADDEESERPVINVHTSSASTLHPPAVLPSIPPTAGEDDGLSPDATAGVVGGLRLAAPSRQAPAHAAAAPSDEAPAAAPAAKSPGAKASAKVAPMAMDHAPSAAAPSESDTSPEEPTGSFTGSAADANAPSAAAASAPSAAAVRGSFIKRARNRTVKPD